MLSSISVQWQYIPFFFTESHKNCSRVQDPYTMRCVPQVHGIVNDTIKFVGGVLTTEMNSALDNPVSDGV